jgi:collagen type I/II/III/V/XI/XXIV/XXVII alpha
MPSRALFSPNHAVFAQGVLIPIGVLVNGGTVRSVETDRVVYSHVETATHDVVLAEELPVETFLDTDGRVFDDGAVAYGRRRGPRRDVAALWDSAACAPLKIVGPEVDRVRAALARQSRLADERNLASCAAG